MLWTYRIAFLNSTIFLDCRFAIYMPINHPETLRTASVFGALSRIWSVVVVVVVVVVANPPKLCRVGFRLTSRL